MTELNSFPRDDLTGRRFNRLRVISFAGRDSSKRARWVCICDCGISKDYDAWAVKSGHTTSCGCARNEAAAKAITTSRKGNHRTYNIYSNMRARCSNQNDRAYHRYGGRGISVCDRWLESFNNFFEDMGACPEGLSLDREDNDGNYEPDNCRWVGKLTQMRNCSATILNTLQVAMIKYLANRGVNRRELAYLTGVKISTIKAIMSGQNWADVVLD